MQGKSMEKRRGITVSRRRIKYSVLFGLAKKVARIGRMTGHVSLSRFRVSSFAGSQLSTGWHGI